jgi:hypothetical protein
LASLELIGKLSCAAIIDHDIGDKVISSVDDIGISSGAGFVDVTDDLVVTSSEGFKYRYSLKCAKSMSDILSKNMGAQSLLENYFTAPDLQIEFNQFYFKTLLVFLNSNLNEEEHALSDGEARKRIKNKSNALGEKTPKFSSEIFPNANASRNIFLGALRSKLLELMQRMDVENIISACNLVLDVENKHILAISHKDKEKVIHEINPTQTTGDFKEFKLVGKNSVDVILKDYKVRFRYKFESDICSSIKLVGSYQKIKKS